MSADEKPVQHRAAPHDYEIVMQSQEEFAAEMAPVLRELRDEWQAGIMAALPDSTSLQDAIARRDRFFAAVEARDLPEVESMLRESPALANLVDAEGYPPLHVLSAPEDVALLDLLLAHGADINGPDLTGATMLMTSDDPEFSRQLLARGALVALSDVVGDTVLHHVSTMQSDWVPAMIGLLLAHGADPDKRNLRGDSALDLAQRSNTPEVVALLQTARR